MTIRELPRPTGGFRRLKRTGVFSPEEIKFIKFIELQQFKFFEFKFQQFQQLGIVQSEFKVGQVAASNTLYN